MHRIFTALAILAVLLLGANVVIGLSGGDYNGAAHAYYASGEALKALQNDPGTSSEAIEQAKALHTKQLATAKELQPAMTRHMMFGIAAALATLMVCSVSITYFVGTSKWCKEVCDTYHLDDRFVRANDAAKRRSFRWATFGALAILGVVALGAASEPTWMNAVNSQNYVQPHYIAALAAIGFICVSFYMQGAALAENGRIIEGVMQEVGRIRAAKGLTREEAGV